MDEAKATGILRRLGGLALLYDAGLLASQGGFDLFSEVEWCLGEDADHLAAEDWIRLIELGQEVVLDPTGNRAAFCDFLYALNAPTAA